MSEQTERQRALDLDAYEALNLLALLEATVGGGPTPMDTGDWHGQIRWKLEALLRDDALSKFPGSPDRPNLTPEEMQGRALDALSRDLEQAREALRLADDLLRRASKGDALYVPIWREEIERVRAALVSSVAPGEQ